MAAHSVKQFARLHPITGRSKTRIPAPPCGCDQPFLPNQRQNCVHHPQPDASHSLPMCGMNTLRAPSGFFCRSAGETLQASKAITRLAAIGGTLCRPTPVPFVDCPARCWLGPKQPWRNRLLRKRSCGTPLPWRSIIGDCPTLIPRMMRLDTCRTLSFCVKIEVRTGGVRHETEDWFGISGRSNVSGLLAP